MSATAPPHALIIEDELVVGLDLQEVLSDLGFGSFAFASTARQAVEQAHLHRPDLVTADLELLTATGVRFASNSKRRGAGCRPSTSPGPSSAWAQPGG
jgi:CheY-like chemotaxis protein